MNIILLNMNKFPSSGMYNVIYYVITKSLINGISNVGIIIIDHIYHFFFFIDI